MDILSVLYFYIFQGVVYCWGVSPTEGLALMWYIPAKFSSEQSPRTVMFMIVLSWGGVSPSYLLSMYYFLSIYFLSLISESCYHLNLPLTIRTNSKWGVAGGLQRVPSDNISPQFFSLFHNIQNYHLCCDLDFVNPITDHQLYHSPL